MTDPAVVETPEEVPKPEPGVAPEPGREPRWGVWLAGGLGLAAALWLAHRSLLGSGLDELQGDPGDARLVQYLLEHAYRWLSGDPLHAHFWDPPFFFPAKNAEALSETLLGIAPAYAVWRALGIARDPAMALCELTLTSLNFAAMFLLLRRSFRSSALGAAVGAVLFAAGAARINHANHPQLLFGGYGVLVVAALIHALRDHGRRGHAWAAVACVATALQLYASFYTGWFFGFFLLVALVWTLATPGPRAALLAGLRAHSWVVGLGTAAAIALLVPLGVHSLRALHALGPREYWPTSGSLPTLQSWFDLGNESWLYGWTGRWRIFNRLPMEPEHRVGLGLLTTAVAAIALIRGRKQPALRMIGAVTVTVILLCTLYRGRLSPWGLVFHLVPGASAIRAVQRIGIWLLLPAGIGVALFLDRLLAHKRRVAAVTIGALCLLEQGLVLGGYSMRELSAEAAGLQARIPAGCQVLLHTPGGFADQMWRAQLDAMFAALDRGIPTVNGYSGYGPPGWELSEPGIATAGDRARVDAALLRWEASSGLDPATVCRVE